MGMDMDMDTDMGTDVDSDMVYLLYISMSGLITT